MILDLLCRIERSFTEMFSEIIEEIGESVTVVRLSADKDEESIIASEIMCVIDPVDDGKYENWRANLRLVDSRRQPEEN